MTTINRLNCKYIESCTLAHLDSYELGFGFVHSSFDKQITMNCVFDTAGREKLHG